MVGDGIITETADVYSFGVVMWQLLTGKQPYKGLLCEDSHDEMKDEIMEGFLILPEVPYGGG